MHEIVENYGKVILALLAIAVVITLAVLTYNTVAKKTAEGVKSINYDTDASNVNNIWNNTEPTTK